MKRCNTAFTLAEVLITLVIIGVIAVMTIPALMQKTQDQELKASLKKSYADLAQAYTQILNDSDGSFNNVCSDMNCIKDKFAAYLSASKNCDTAATDGTNPCIYNTQSVLKRYNGNIYGGSWYAASLVLNNGSIILFGDGDGVYKATNTNCFTQYASSNVKSCGWLIVDVNGVKGPNTVGRDVFHFWITDKSMLPVGALDQNNAAATGYNSSSCDKNNPSAPGWGCAAKFLQE